MPEKDRKNAPLTAGELRRQSQIDRGAYGRQVSALLARRRRLACRRYHHLSDGAEPTMAMQLRTLRPTSFKCKGAGK